MFAKPNPLTPDQTDALLAAANAAARAIPPAFPLAATVAVNPFLGQTHLGLAQTAARLRRVAGIRLTRPRHVYAAAIANGQITGVDLGAALRGDLTLADINASLGTTPSPPGALPTVAALAALPTGTDWPALIDKTFGLWAAGHFDQGQALWSPAPGRGAYAAWRAWASADLTPEIAGLRGFCATVDGAPDTADRAIVQAATILGITEAAAETAFHRLLCDLGGWAQHARWLLWQAELAGGTDATLTDLLAIRLTWDAALLAHAPQTRQDWANAVAIHATPVMPTRDDQIDAVLQTAAELAYQRRLGDLLGRSVPPQGRPALQAAFCIDVRSEVFRRALESQSPAVATVGFAGFFGLPVAHRAFGSDVTDTHLPVLLNPAMTATSAGTSAIDTAARIAARTTRAWGRFRQAAVSSFAFVEGSGAFYSAKLIKDAFALSPKTTALDPSPRFDPPLSPDAKADTAAAVLRAMGMTTGLAPIVLLAGHGANVTNNPYESAYHCGACGGQTGAVSARLLAALLNDPQTRAGLPPRGIDLPNDTHFIAALHDTTTDHVSLYPDDHAVDLAQVRAWLDQATLLARTERALRLPCATAASIPTRATDWAQVRPEWGLAGCASFIAAPRSVTAGADLGGRAFLHSYDWEDDTGFATLELILTAPVVVASWISLQYYGSVVAPEVFGGGNKLIHNVIGGIGVVQGNGGRLRPGLPVQAIHDGERLAHYPLRLTVLIAAPQVAISDVLDRHPQVRALFDNGWLHLLTLEDGRIAARYVQGGKWITARKWGATSGVCFGNLDAPHKPDGPQHETIPHQSDHGRGRRDDPPLRLCPAALCVLDTGPVPGQPRQRPERHYRPLWLGHHRLWRWRL